MRRLVPLVVLVACLAASPDARASGGGLYLSSIETFGLAAGLTSPVPAIGLGIAAFLRRDSPPSAAWGWTRTIIAIPWALGCGLFAGILVPYISSPLMAGFFLSVVAATAMFGWHAYRGIQEIGRVSDGGGDGVAIVPFVDVDGRRAVGLAAAAAF